MRLLLTDAAGPNLLLLPSRQRSGEPVGAKDVGILEVSDFDGVRHRLEDFRGDVVDVAFWASWCGPCARELPDIQELQISHPDDLVLVALNRAEPPGLSTSQ